RAQRGQDRVLLRQDPVELHPEDPRVEEVLEPEAGARRSILVGRPDPPPCRPDLRPGQTCLAGDVERPLVRQDQVAGEAGAEAGASTESKRPRNRGSETEIQVSRVRSASGSKTRRRLTGRATRLPRATAGLLSGRAGPRTVRGRGEYSSAAARHRTATARHGG